MHIDHQEKKRDWHHIEAGDAKQGIRLGFPVSNPDSHVPTTCCDVVPFNHSLPYPSTPLRAPETLTGLVFTFENHATPAGRRTLPGGLSGRHTIFTILFSGGLRSSELLKKKVNFGGT
jgi:hypothetical protein